MNLKSKRKRNLIRKTIELTNMLDMRIFLVMKCGDTGKVSIYNSFCPGNGGVEMNRSGASNCSIEQAIE